MKTSPGRKERRKTRDDKRCDANANKAHRRKVLDGMPKGSRTYGNPKIRVLSK